MKFYVNVTDEEGVLVGRFPLEPDDLDEPHQVGVMVLEQLGDKERQALKEETLDD